MRGFLRIMWNVWGYSVSLAAILFMVLTFVEEGIFGKGMLFFEPNRAFALFELGLTIFGVVFLVHKFLRLSK